MSSIASAAILQANGIEPVAQFTCRDRNRIALYSDLLGISALEVNNILILNGDNPTSGDQPEAKPVFDLKSHELMHVAKMMTNEAIMPSKKTNVNDTSNTPETKKLTSPANFFIGAADVPTADFSRKWVEGIRKKHESGARFVQTQLCYDMDIIKSYAHLVREEGLSEKIFFLIGSGPLLSENSAKWMRDNLWGVEIPDQILDRLKNADDSQLEGIQICSEQLQLMSEIEGIAGVHLMAPINTKSIPESIKHAQIKNRKPDN